VPTPYRVSVSFAGSDHSIVCGGPFRTRAEAVKFICQKIGYPHHWRRWMKKHTGSTFYISSDRALGARYIYGQWTKRDLED
jgi:hypothetical protein